MTEHHAKGARPLHVNSRPQNARRDSWTLGQLCPPTGRAALRESTEDRAQAWNRRGAESRSAGRAPGNDAETGGLHAGPAQSRPAGYFRASSFRFRPRRPATAPATCFVRTLADAREPANHRCGAKHPPPKRTVPRSHWGAAHSKCFPASGSFSRQPATGGCGVDLAARQGERFENALVAECRPLVQLLLVARIARRLGFLAGCTVIGHSRSSQVVKQQACPPV